MVDEVLQEVHLPGRHVVEADGAVAAAAQALLLGVELVAPVPGVPRDVAGDEVVLGHEGEEPLLALLVAGVRGGDAEVLHALPHLHVLRPAAALPTHRPVIHTCLHREEDRIRVSTLTTCS